MRTLILLLMVLAGCASKPNTTSNDRENHELPIIDITHEYPEVNIDIQEVADVEYIPLETKQDALLDGSLNYIITDSLIFCYNSRTDGSIFIFEKNGELKCSINHKGGSGDEYIRCSDLAVDLERKEMYVLDYPSRRQILVYAFDGKFIRKLKIPFKLLRSFLDYNDNYLFAYDASDEYPFNEKKTVEYNYIYISKKNGEILPIKLDVPDKLKSALDVKTPEGKTYSIHTGLNPFLCNGNEVIIADFACDTIYTLRNEILYPIAVKSPSPHLMEYPYLVAPYFRTDRYLCLVVKEKRMIEEGVFASPRLLICDTKKGEIASPYFTNSDFLEPETVSFLNYRSIISIDNCAFCYLPAGYLVECYQENKLKGRLKIIASRLKEDDNPVLMLMKFKE